MHMKTFDKSIKHYQTKHIVAPTRRHQHPKQYQKRLQTITNLVSPALVTCQVKDTQVKRKGR